MTHKRAEGRKTRSNSQAQVPCPVLNVFIHPGQQTASVFLVDEVRRGSQVQRHPWCGFYVRVSVSNGEGAETRVTALRVPKVWRGCLIRDHTINTGSDSLSAPSQHWISLGENV